MQKILLETPVIAHNVYLEFTEMVIDRTYLLAYVSLAVRLICYRRRYPRLIDKYLASSVQIKRCS